MVENKPVAGRVKFLIQPGKANPAPPIGSALGQRKVNIMDFCKQFNERSKDMGTLPVRVYVDIYRDASFAFIVEKPSTSVLIKEKMKLKSGSSQPGLNPIASISMAQVDEIANYKMEDLNAHDLEHARTMIIGTARSMGINLIKE